MMTRHEEAVAAPTAGGLEPLRWDGERLWILDQRRLPAEQVWLAADTPDAVIEAIAGMAVRGAPAIAMAGAWGLALAARADAAGVEPAAARIEAARPTAVHLAWTLRAMLRDRPAEGLWPHWRDFALRMQREDAAMNRRMGDYGAALLPDQARVLTHCNTGALATGGWGTALGVVRSAHAAGRLATVWVDETRPWLQGARLTAWELMHEGIDFSLIADAAAASVMARGLVDWVVVGADRIAANGDTANKIGTYMLAVLARHHGLGFMVVAPTATIDPATAHGRDIPIEERPAEELAGLAGVRSAPPDCPASNPVFDVTPAELITAIVTERGVIHRPDATAIRGHLSGENPPAAC